MKRSAGTWSLRKSLYTNLVVVLTIILVALLVYNWVVYSYSRDQVRTTHLILAKKADQQMEDLVSSLDATAKRVIYASSLQAITFATNPIEYLRNRSAAMSYFEDTSANSALIASYYILRSDGFQVHYGNEWPDRQRYKETIESTPVLQSGYFHPFFLTQTIESAQPQTGRPLELVYCLYMHNVRTSSLPEEAGAVCLVACNVDAFINLWNTDQYTEEATALLYQGRVVSSSRPLSPQQASFLYDAPQTQDGDPQTTQIGGEAYIFGNIPLAETGWSMAYMVPESVLITPILRVRNVSMVVLLLAMGILALLLEIVLRRTFSQVHLLTVAFLQTPLVGSQLIPAPALLELRSIAQGFNDTITELRQAQRKEKEMTLSLYDAQLAHNQALINAYKNQITPHFLFNTMETMRSMAHRMNATDLENLIRSTSLFLRYTLRSTFVVPLREELRYIEVYCRILDFRFPNRYHLRLEASQQALDTLIPSTVLQPVVENSIQYGYNGQKAPLVIAIKAWTLHRDGQDWLRMRIVDNGNGMSPETLSQVENRMRQGDMADGNSHIGLRNIYHRLSLSFGEAFEMHLRSRQGRYTSIELLLPQHPLAGLQPEDSPILLQEDEKAALFPIQGEGAADRRIESSGRHAFRYDSGVCPPCTARNTRPK